MCISSLSSFCRAWPLLLVSFLALSAACRTSGGSPAVDRHNPEAVLGAYFNAWNRNDLPLQKSFMTTNYAGLAREPVDSVRVLSIKLLDAKTSRLWSTGSPEATGVYIVVFDYKPTGRGFSMEGGRYTWSYTLTWDASRNSWLISNYGAG